MKKIAFLILTLISIVSHATQIMWVGVDENSIVHIGDQTMSIVDWMSTLACAPVDIGGRIRIGDTALPAGYEDPPEQNPPAVSFIDGVTEFGLVVVDDNDEPTGMYTDWQPIKLPEGITKTPITIYYDIGYWDENANWDFVTVATAIGSLDQLWDNHTYTAGTLAPPTETPWCPSAFYAIPEPSTLILALAGMAFLIKRRK